MANSRDSLIKLLYEQAAAGSSMRPNNFGGRFSAAVAQSKLESMVQEEENQKYADKVFNHGSLRGKPSLYGIEGANRVREQEVQDADLQRSNMLEEQKRTRQHKLALQDVDRNAELDKLTKKLNPKSTVLPSANTSTVNSNVNFLAGDTNTDPNNPFASALKKTNAGLDAAAGANTVEGFDVKNPAHVQIVKGIIQSKIKEGKPVEVGALRKEIQDQLLKANDVSNKFKEQQLKSIKMDGEISSILNKQKNAKTGIKELGIKATNAIDDKIVNLNMQMGKFTNIAELFRGNNGEFLNAVTQLKYKTLAQAQRFGVSLTDAQKKGLTKFAAFRRGVVDVFNVYRKDITGAAAADTELKRLEKAFIHMGMSSSEFDGALRGLMAFGKIDMYRAMKMKENVGEATAPDYENRLLAGDESLNSDIDKRLKGALEDWNKTVEWLNGKASDLDKLRGVERDESGNVTAIPDPAPGESIIVERDGTRKRKSELIAERDRLMAKRQALVQARETPSSPIENAVAKAQAQQPIRSPGTSQESNVQQKFDNIDQYPPEVQQAVLQNQLTKGGFKGR